MVFKRINRGVGEAELFLLKLCALQATISFPACLLERGWLPAMFIIVKVAFRFYSGSVAGLSAA
jgi:hypothetical protein